MDLPTPRIPTSSARCDVLFAALLDARDEADACAARGDYRGLAAATDRADVLRQAHRVSQ